jgi:hypothetical protein
MHHTSHRFNVAHKGRCWLTADFIEVATHTYLCLVYICDGWHRRWSCLCVCVILSVNNDGDIWNGNRKYVTLDRLWGTLSAYVHILALRV